MGKIRNLHHNLAAGMNTDWRKGSVRDEENRFILPWLGGAAAAKLPSFMILARWFSSRHPPPAPPLGTFELIKPDFSANQDEMRCTWLGHATCFVQVGGLGILTDPVFSQRCSPVQWAGPKRYVPPACSISDLPHVDLVMISHDHYDHLDYDSICELERVHKPVFACGLELGSTIESFGVDKSRVVELDWWDEVKLLDGKLDLQFLPVQHWSKRQAFGDERRSLWGGFGVAVKGFRFFFNGDTGYHQELYEEIGRRCAPFDLAAIPIGAYEPRVIMQKQHINPEEAFLIHQHLQAKLSVGIHFGTFILTDEPVAEPAAKIRDICQAHPEAPPFVAVKHGSSVCFNKDRSFTVGHEMR